MAKAKLTSLTQRWINSKTSKSNNGKKLKNQTVKLSVEDTPGRKIQTIYLSAEARKLLWQTRVEKGDTISSTVDALIIRHLK